MVTSIRPQLAPSFRSVNPYILPPLFSRGKKKNVTDDVLSVDVTAKET